MNDKQQYRLVTKCDFDGLACGVLLKEMALIDRIAFAHPKDIESGKVAIAAFDITAGLPYRETAHLAFDHYPSRSEIKGKTRNLVVDQRMPSTSRVIYNYYGRERFRRVSPDMLKAVDKGFSGNIGIDDILYPTGWMLLNHLIDHRTGLEIFQRFPTSTPELIMRLVDYCRDHTIWDVLNLPDVEERLNLYFSCIEQYKAQLLRCATVHFNLVVTDMRKEQVMYPGNRFMIHALFPECSVSLQVIADSDSDKIVFAVGKSILDRSYGRDIGKILEQYGGGGHANAGTCQARGDQADDVLGKLIGELQHSFLKSLLLGYFNCHMCGKTCPCSIWGN